MKPISSWLVPALLLLCAVLVVGAMGWITQGTIATERERAGAEMRAIIQERTRLALWRMDSLGAAILLDESAYPEADSRLPVRLRFSVTATGELRQLEENAVGEELSRALDGRAMDVMCDITRTQPARQTEISAPNQTGGQQGQVYNGYAPLDPLVQKLASQNEQEMRSKVVQSTIDNSTAWLNRVSQPQAKTQRSQDAAHRESTVRIQPSGGNLASAHPPAALELSREDPKVDAAMISQDKDMIDFVTDSVVGPPRSAWVRGVLLLARRVAGGGEDEMFDGAWVDDEALRSLLLGEIRDLLVDASLLPASEPGDDGMVLASFPFRLVVPSPDFAPPPLRSATVISLSMSWAAAILALVAIFCLVRGVMRLSERRASFVSAVTHELRTPLTTFRLYSDLLGSGVVKEERRGEYLGVLTREADRLTHLVENVLAFSRIERGNARSQVQTIAVGEFLDDMKERLEQRLEAAGLHLSLDIPPDLLMRADRVAVEHVIFNLIDNAAKYAAQSAPPVVSISASQEGKSMTLRVCDHGPGIPATELRRIFRPFHKSAHEAAESKPGVGLGLALSRRLARQQGGELTCVPRPGGACFELRLPIG